MLIHYGHGRWFVIDSCISPENKGSAALNYLTTIGVDVSSQVKGVLITHWHQDHIRGAADFFKECHSANLYISAALQDDEALKLAALFKKDLSGTDSGIREFREIIAYLVKERDRSRIIPVSAHTSLFADLANNTRLLALSPSPQAHALALVEFQHLRPNIGKKRLRLFPRDENFNAVATHFSFGDFSVLLGSDLEDSGNPDTGWTAVINSKIYANQSLEPAQLYKVAHHGSDTGHHPGIWNDLLIPQPLSIVTPFITSKLPSELDIQRLKGLSGNVIVTRDPVPKKRIKRDPMVEREISTIAKERRVLSDKLGHIQIRASMDGNYSVFCNSYCMCA